MGKNVKTVQESAEQHSMEEYDLFNMKSVNQCKPYTVTLEVNGKPLVMEIDAAILNLPHPYIESTAILFNNQTGAHRTQCIT